MNKWLRTLLESCSHRIWLTINEQMVSAFEPFSAFILLIYRIFQRWRCVAGFTCSSSPTLQESLVKTIYFLFRHCFGAYTVISFVTINNRTDACLFARTLALSTGHLSFAHIKTVFALFNLNLVRLFNGVLLLNTQLRQYCAN